MGTLFASWGALCALGDGITVPDGVECPRLQRHEPGRVECLRQCWYLGVVGRVSVDRSRWAGARWRRDEDVAADQAVQRAALREDVQVDWADDEPGTAARGSGLGDAQAPARHARQAASVEGALLGFDGGHEYEAQ